VLGAGGVAGWGIHFGAVEALEDAGLPVAGASRVVGTSAGAAVGASALGGVDTRLALEEVLRPPSPDERRAYLAEARERNRGRSWAPAAPRLALRSLLPDGPGLGVAWAGLAPAGAFPNESLARFPGLDHDGWPPPLRVVAVRLEDGARVVFGTADAPDVGVPTAVRASQSVPLMFAPTRVAGQRYVDGATWSSTHADLLLDDPPDLAVVVGPMAREGRALGLRHARARARDELTALRHAGTEVVAVRPGPDAAPLFRFAARRDPGLGGRLVDLGRRMVTEALARRGLA
jgi:NTE family protein